VKFTKRRRSEQARGRKSINPIKAMSLKRRGECSGQALVELLLVVVVALMFAFGIFELGVYVHNLAVLSRTADNAAHYASYAAPLPRLEEVFSRERANLLPTAFSYQDYDPDEITVEIYNPHENRRLAPLETDEFPFDEPRLAPGKENVAPYLFWTQGYRIVVSVDYAVGIKIPFLPPLTFNQRVRGSQIIQVSNDIDRDGLVDSWEAGYVLYYLNEIYEGGGVDREWVHPSHRDYTGQLDTVGDPDIDGDGLAKSEDEYPYDYTNDGIEDKFDVGNNRLYQNPAVGP